MGFALVRSLKSRILVLVLTMVLLSIWLLTIGISRILRSDMEKVLGDQQVATVHLVAAQISANFKERADALQLLAGAIDASLIDQPEALHARLLNRPVLQILFNDGVLVTRVDGTAVAESPGTSRIGLNFRHRDDIGAALREGRTTVGRAVMGQASKAPSFDMTAPIRNAQGVVIGALSGATDLGRANFLDSLVNSNYGKSGGYLVVDPKHRIFVTATVNDKKLIMQALPAPGVNAVLDRRLRGFDGAAVNVGSQGMQVLTSSGRISLAEWFVISTLPTQEAFAPIRSLETKLTLSAVLLTLVSLGLTWWMLMRLLAPLQSASEAVRALDKEDVKQGPLPIATQDEIGELIGGVNQVLAVAKQRERALRESEYRLRTIVESMSEGLVTQDSAGRIVSANPAAERILGLSLERMKGLTSMVARGDLIRDDESPCQGALGPAMEALRAGTVVRDRVLGISAPRTSRRWISVNAVPLFLEGSSAPASVISTVVDITDRKNIELALQASEAQFRAFFDKNLAIMLLIRPGDGRIVDANQAAIDYYGYEHETLCNLHVYDLNTLSPEECLREMAKAKSEQRNFFNFRHRNARGLVCDVEVYSTCVQVNDSDTLFSIIHDVTERKRIEEALNTMNRDFVTLLESSSDFLYFKDRDSRFRYCSQTMANITGHKSWRDMVGKHDLEVFPPETAEIYGREEGPILSEGTPLLDKIDPYVKADGSRGWVSTNKWPMFADDGQTVVGLFGISRDVTDSKRLGDELLIMATTDFLTGANSRRSFVGALDHEIARMQRDSTCLCAIMMFDLDHFKLVNDTHGHATGDEVLKHVVKLLSSEIRKVDLIGRMGGEEFAILMPGADIVAARRCAERFRQNLEVAPLMVEGRPIVVTVSIGLSILKACDDSSGPALERVDQALYRAKHHGRDCLEVSL